MDIQSTQQENESQYVSPEAEHSVPADFPGRCHGSDNDEIPDGCVGTGHNTHGQALADAPQTLDAFLQSIERRAFVMTRYALQNEDDALDTVQDAMLKLCEYYSDRRCEEWGPLFFRILHNGITDRYRPRGINRLKRWMGRAPAGQSDSGQLEPLPDTMDTLPSAQSGPQDELESMQRSSRINDALSRLSTQQREVFLLRRWQGLSVRETAEAMNIGEGSVKTHLSRAIAALRERLQDHQP